MSSEPPAVLEAESAVTEEVSESPRTVWAYAYQIVPPQTRSQLRSVRALLDQEHAAVHDGSGTWGGRLILGAKMTRIMIVSDSLERSREVNRRLEAELNLLGAEFTVVEPVGVAERDRIGRAVNPGNVVGHRASHGEASSQSVPVKQ